MRISKCVTYIILFVMINWAVWFSIEPANYYRCVLHEVQSQETNYDLIVIGESHGQFAYSPDVIEKEAGYKTYNLCRHFVNISELPYILMEADYHNSPKVVIYDIDSTYWLSNENTNYYRGEYIYPAIKNPLTKLKYIVDENLSENYRYTLCRYIIRGTDEIKKIPDNVRTKLSKNYREDYDVTVTLTGRAMGRYRGKGFMYSEDKDENIYNPVLWNSDAVADSHVKSFAQMARYCNENGIILIAVTSPQPSRRVAESNYAEYHDYFENLCSEYDVIYWDYNYDSNISIEWTDDDFKDGEGHMMGEFAERYSEELGKRLKELTV